MQQLTSWRLEVAGVFLSSSWNTLKTLQCGRNWRRTQSYPLLFVKQSKSTKKENIQKAARSLLKGPYISSEARCVLPFKERARFLTDNRKADWRTAKSEVSALDFDFSTAFWTSSNVTIYSALKKCSLHIFLFFCS